MRRVLALVLLAVSLAGCAREGCCNEWSFQGDDTALFDALAGVAGVNETREAGWGVRHAVLDDIWGDYALVGVIDANGTSLSGRSAERVQLSAGAPPDADIASLRANITSFLRATVDADEETYARIVDALLANATPLDGGGAPHEAGADAPPTSSNVTYVHYATELTQPLRGQALFDALTAQEGGWIPEESFGRDQGSVEVAGWTFLFGFPTRTVDRPDFYLSVNAHGGLLGRLVPGKDVDEADARREVEEKLSALGVRADTGAWLFAGSHVGGPAPEGSTPTPTP